MRLEGKIDALRVILDERLQSLDHKVEFGDRSALQTVQILAETVGRLEAAQTDQGKFIRNLDSMPARVKILEDRSTWLARTSVTALVLPMIILIVTILATGVKP